MIGRKEFEARLEDVAKSASAELAGAVFMHRSEHHGDDACNVNLLVAEVRGIKLLLGGMKADAVECPDCHGTGRVQKRLWVLTPQIFEPHSCPTCRSFGRIWPITCKCGKEIGTDMVDVRKADKPRCPWCGVKLPYPYNVE